MREYSFMWNARLRSCYDEIVGKKYTAWGEQEKCGCPGKEVLTIIIKENNLYFIWVALF